MKVIIIGSSQYRDEFSQHKYLCELRGDTVRIPAFDDHPDLDEFGVCLYNREAIEWADRVDIIWDGRSVGTILDFGMAFALHKHISIVYIEKKTIRGVMEGYARTDEGQYPMWMRGKPR